LSSRADVVRFFMLADQIEGWFEKARAQVDQLTTSFLTSASTGKLVPRVPPTNRHCNGWNTSILS
jgi:hypothetical protein